MLSGLLLVLNIIVCLALIGVVLLQRSEGGALGGGGGPTGLVTTRGAGDLLTRTTWVLFAAFLGLSLWLTLLGGHERSSQAIINRLKLQSINPSTLPARGPGPAGQPAAPPADASGVAGGLAPPKPTVRVPSSQSAPTLPPSFAPPAPAIGLPPPVEPAPKATKP